MIIVGESYHSRLQIIIIKYFSKIMTREQSKHKEKRHHEQEPSETADYRKRPTKTPDTGIIQLETIKQIYLQCSEKQKTNFKF